MQNEISEKMQRVGSMHKRRVLMEDGRRYLIYYTFGDENAVSNASGDASNAALPESAAHNSTVEEENLNV